jgi:hypothetical protein
MHDLTQTFHTSGSTTSHCHVSASEARGWWYSAEMAEPRLDPPTNGGRLLVKLDASPAHAASYTVVLATASGTWEAEAVVRESDGQIEQSPWRPAAAVPDWLEQATHALLRSAWQRRRAGHPWPRRLSRWRPAPSETESA